MMGRSERATSRLTAALDNMHHPAALRTTTEGGSRPDKAAAAWVLEAYTYNPQQQVNTELGWHTILEDTATLPMGTTPKEAELHALYRATTLLALTVLHHIIHYLSNQQHLPHPDNIESLPPARRVLASELPRSHRGSQQRKR